MENTYPRFDGRMHRKIDLKEWDENTVVGWLEDDFHHYGVTVIHDRKTVKGVRMAAIRVPWTACPEAAAPLQQLVGKPLVSRASNIGLHLQMRQQCTHVFDLAGLVLAHAAQGRIHRRYHVVVPDREILGYMPNGKRIQGPAKITLRQDDEQVMWWNMEGRRIAGPEKYAGQTLDTGFRVWTETMPEEEAEYCSIMRRAILVAGGRVRNLDNATTAAAENNPPLCHTFQPGIAPTALRVKGANINYEDRPELMLSHLDEMP
jgi:hypothetical protein